MNIPAARSGRRPARLGIALAIILLAAGVVAWKFGLLGLGRGKLSQNAIMVIAPYRYAGTWVFDDPAVGLKREPFVGGTPAMIDRLVAKIPDAAGGFRLTFSAREFPGYQEKLTWIRGDSVGNWYRLDDPPMEGWLCPALLRYYDAPPKEIYVKADPKE
jgi:hypothetical protein